MSAAPVSEPESALKGWHPGETYVQSMMHLPGRVSISAVLKKLPEQHRLFHSTRLHFLPVTTLDSQGRPWATILTSKDGAREFIRSPTDSTLEIDARVWDGDPIIDNLSDLAKSNTSDSKTLISGIGIEVSTRRRNKITGSISDAKFVDKDLFLKLSVTQALGLCPKYINVRQVQPFPNTDPRIIYKKLEMRANERLPNDVIAYILAADTAYIGSSYVAAPENEDTYPSHLGSNHRGGRPGFIRVRPSDGRTLVLPNYAGNRLMSSLGNIHITPLASLVFPSFHDGSILYVTGTAKNLFGPPAREIMPASNVITTITVAGYVFMQNALPVRELPGSKIERSPYSPPIRYLAEEKPPETTYEDVSLTFVSSKVHNDSLVTFTLVASRPVEINPSQNVVLDLSDFVRKRSHELLEWTEEDVYENDDCVRTWTVSIFPTPDNPCKFSITMRSINGGFITPILYPIARNAGAHCPIGKEVDITPLQMKVRLRGVGGNLPVPLPIAACDGGHKLLWIAGGIGLTPFLSLTRHVAQHSAKTYGLWDIVLVVSTREPDVMLNLISDALAALDEIDNPTDLTYTIHMFSPMPFTFKVPPFVRVKHHKGRLLEDGSFFASIKAKERDIHICGPLPFVTTSMTALKNSGADAELVKRERFTY